MVEIKKSSANKGPPLVWEFLPHNPVFLFLRALLQLTFPQKKIPLSVQIDHISLLFSNFVKGGNLSSGATSPLAYLRLLPPTHESDPRCPHHLPPPWPGRERGGGRGGGRANRGGPVPLPLHPLPSRLLPKHAEAAQPTPVSQPLEPLPPLLSTPILSHKVKWNNVFEFISRSNKRFSLFFFFTGQNIVGNSLSGINENDTLSKPCSF